MGLLNGVILVTRLGTTVLPDALMNVAELTPNMASLTDAQLSLALQRTPDREATEFQLQSESASDMQQINSMVEVFGVSSFSAMDRSASAGVAGQSDGVKGAVGGSMGNSKAGGSADSGASQTSEQLSRTTKSLVKSQYYYEPKMKVHIDRSMLQPTPAFRSWSLELSHALCTLRGERDCSRFDPQHASPVTRPTLPPANLSVQVTFIETNLDPALLVTGTSLNPSYVNAVQRAIAANADGVPQQSIQVVVSNPSAAKLNSGTIYDNVQVLAIIPPSSGASGQMTLENLQKAYTRGFLQNAILKQTLAVPNIGVAQIKVAGSVQPNEIVNLYVTSPTSALLTASTRQVQPIKVLLENGPSDSQAAVADFLYNFGTHVCPQALLGGWWRLTASYVSTESHDMVEVEDVTSLAIEDRKSRSHSLSGSVSGGGAAASGGQSSGTSSDSTRALTDGERTALQNAAKTATINVEQSWKGGASGTTPELWRKSLDYSLSSNWKTIDRSVEKCIGVWSFVEDNYTADALCHGWVHMYLTGLGLDSSLAKPEAIARACSSAFYMNILRVSALETQKAQEAAKDRYDSQQCLLHRSFSYFKFSPTQLRANRQQPFSRIRSMSFRFMGQAVSIEHADFLYMAANSSADSSPYQLVSGLGPICADSTPMPISETLAIDPSQCMDFCSASKIECGYAVYNSNGTCMIFQPCGGAMNSVPGIQGSSDVPDLGGCGGAPWMRMMTGSYQDCAQWCIQHPNCTKFQRWISRNTCYIANMSSAVQAVEPNGSPDWQCGIVQDNSTNTYTFPGNGDPFSTSVEIWKRKPSHRTIQGSGAVPGLGGCGGAPWMMNMTGSYQDCAQWCIQHPGCTKFQRWISQNKCWMANMSSAVQAVEPNGSPEWQCGLITQSWSSTTLKVDTYILQEKQDPFGICPQIARVQAPCNGCGPDWGNLAACEAQCNMNDACRYITYFMDQGCRLYSSCDSYDQGIVVFTEVYKRPDDYSIEFPQGSLVLSFPSPVPVDEFTYTMGSDDQSDPISFKLSAANAASGPYMDLLDKSLPPSWVRQSHTKPVGIPNYYREVPLPWMTLQGASGSGTHWDANQKRCALKQCFCTVEVDGNTTTQKGTFGDDCEQDGAINCATCCNEGQKQTCASLNCKASNPSLIQKVGSGNQLCENPQCSSAVDSQTCCQNKFLAKFFIIQISTKSDKNCGTNADVEAQLTGLDADGNQMVYAGYTKLDNKGYNDFEKGDSDQYPLQSDLDFVPDQVCLRSANSKRWCVEEVYVFSPDLPEPNQVGMAKTWTPISHGYQCHDLL
ncbi:unnamed protein product [Polarella glacialis]|nr:unnamed protein product [Polarella glacialis]